MDMLLNAKINKVASQTAEIANPTAEKADKVWTANADGTAEFKTPTGVGSGETVACRITNSTSQSIPHNVETTLSFDTESFDDNGMHDNVNPSRLTIQVNESGKYYISGKVEFPAHAIGIRILKMYLNNITNVGRATLPVNSVNTATTLSVATLYDLVAGDYITLSVFQNSGAVMSLVSLSKVTPCFEIIKVSSSSQNVGDGLTEADVLRIVQDYITANSINEV